MCEKIFNFLNEYPGLTNRAVYLGVLMSGYEYCIHAAYAYRCQKSNSSLLLWTGRRCRVG